MYTLVRRAAMYRARARSSTRVYVCAYLLVHSLALSLVRPRPVSLVIVRCRVCRKKYARARHRDSARVLSARSVVRGIAEIPRCTLATKTTLDALILRYIKCRVSREASPLKIAPRARMKSTFASETQRKKLRKFTACSWLF